MDRQRRRIWFLGLRAALALAPLGLLFAWPTGASASDRRDGAGTTTSASNTGSGAVGVVTSSGGNGNAGSTNSGSNGSNNNGSHQSGTAGPTLICKWAAYNHVNPLGSEGPITDFGARIPGERYWRSCYNAATGQRVEGPELRTYTPADAAQSAAELRAELVNQARTQLTINLPNTAFSPSTQTLPNLRTWLWDTNPTTQTTSATAGGVTLTLTATHTTSTFRINPAVEADAPSVDDNTTITCNGPGTAYNPAKPAKDQKPSCSVFLHAPTRQITITTTATWEMTWTATDGTNGNLGTITRQNTTPYRIQELHTTIYNA
jgi:hypothetical protein